VTAGLLLLLKFSAFISTKAGLFLLFFFGFITLCMASVIALVEEDVKKVVALRTLSQIGLGAIVFGAGFFNLSFIHLISHGFFKSLLFIQIGYLIHYIQNQQDCRGYCAVSYVPFFLQLQLKVSLFCLIGLFFSNGLVVKEVVIELYNSSMGFLFVIVFFWVGVVLTFFYSYRVWLCLFSFSGVSIFSFQKRFIVCYSSLLLCVFSFIFIWWFVASFLCLPAFVLCVESYLPFYFLVLFLM